MDQLFWLRTGPRTGDLCTASGRVLTHGITLDAAGEEWLGVTITVTRSRSRSY